MNKVIIAGSRSITDAALVRLCIDDALAKGLEITEVVSGHAAGVDMAGEFWARPHGIPIKQFPVTDREWRTYGKYAGPRRNAEMARYADAAILVWDGVSRGTANMRDQLSASQRLYLYIWEYGCWRQGYVPDKGVMCL